MARTVLLLLLALAPAAWAGSVYLNVAVDPALVTTDQDMLSFSLESDESPNWYIAAVVFNNDGTSRVVDATVSGGQGYAGVTGLSSVMSVAFAVTNLGDLVHDPDSPEFNGSNFNYSLAFFTQPSITGVSPRQVTQGDQGAVVTITGTGFQSGILVDFGEGITTTGAVVAASGNSIDATLDVGGSAPIGWHALRAYYENGPETRLDQGLEVLTGQGPEITALSPDSGAPGETLNVEVSGLRFRRGTTVSFGGGGIAVARVDFIDEGILIAQVEIDPFAEPGQGRHGDQPGLQDRHAGKRILRRRRDRRRRRRRGRAGGQRRGVRLLPPRAGGRAGRASGPPHDADRAHDAHRRRRARRNQGEMT